MNSYCPKCDEYIITASILRHDTHSRPTEQTINPEYCPLCGTKLEKFNGWKDSYKECGL